METMKITVNLKLNPTEEQKQILHETLERCNEACNFVSEQAITHKVFGQFALQSLVYRDVRNKFNLSAQVAVQCIKKVVDSYVDKKKRVSIHVFRKWSAQPYDDRIFGFKGNDTISIWTLSGRIRIPFVCGDRQRALLPFRKGEVDLLFVRKKWYISIVCDIPEQEPEFFEKVLGVDFGIVNIATDSDGEVFSGKTVEENRLWHQKRRAILQKKGTKASRKRLRKLSGRQHRFQTWVNHNISKQLVSKAKRTQSAIALEDLKGIRKGVTARKGQRNKLHNWSFGQLRQFVTYKALMYGVSLVTVDPRNTSRTCPECGCVDKKNRKSQESFSCIDCGHSGMADHIAAINIAKVAINQPEFSACRKTG